MLVLFSIDDLIDVSIMLSGWFLFPSRYFWLKFCFKAGHDINPLYSIFSRNECEPLVLIPSIIRTTTLSISKSKYHVYTNNKFVFYFISERLILTSTCLRPATNTVYLVKSVRLKWTSYVEKYTHQKKCKLKC